MEAFQGYVIARLKEASTWRGLVLIATAAGLPIGQADAVLQIGLFVAGAIGAVFPDYKG